MTHLVTGGSGFLGNLIARRLYERGEKVRVLDLWEDPSRPAGIEFVKCDIRDRAGVARAMQGIDIVHHNVALVPLTKSGDMFWDVNVNGSMIAAEESAKAQVKAFINMSSSAVFGKVESPITQSTPTKPAEIYGKAKLAGEQVVVQTCEKYNIPVITIRPRTILGGGRLGIFQILFEWISENRNVYVIGSGNEPFQFIHALDLMDAYMLALDSGKPGTYNVGTDRFGTMREALENLIVHAGTNSKVKSLPKSLTVATLQILDWLRLSPLAPYHYKTFHREVHFDIGPLLEMGWKPKYSNDEMFRETYDWFLKNHKEENEANHPQGEVSAHRKSVKQKILWLVKRFS